MAKKASAATTKTVDNQLLGLALAEKLITDIIQIGVSAIDKKVIKSYQPQIKELGNYTIAGVQEAFITLLGNIENKEEVGNKPIFEQITYIYSLVKQTTEYFTKLKANPDSELDITLEGKVRLKWKMSELKKMKLLENDVDVTQLSFYSFVNSDAKKIINIGLWINLQTGVIYQTIKKEALSSNKFFTSFSPNESVFLTIHHLPTLYIESQEYNPIVWPWANEPYTESPLKEEDIKKIQTFAQSDYALVVHEIKNNLKNIIHNPHPYVLLSLHKAFLNKDELVLEDSNGNYLTVKDINDKSLLSTNAFQDIISSDCSGYSLLAMVNNDLDTGLISVQPVTLITPSRIIRLLY